MLWFIFGTLKIRIFQSLVVLLIMFWLFLLVSKSQYFFSNMNSNFSNLLDMRNLREQVKEAFCYQKLFWPFTVWINCSSDLKNFANSWPSASKFKSFSRSLEQFFHTVGQNNFGNKIPLFSCPNSIVLQTKNPV